MLTPEEGQSHPEANILSQAVGSKEVIDVDVSIPSQATMSGDIFLLCSDGLHNLVAADEMARIAGSQRPNEACRTLVNLANERGGHDNITVQILDVVGQLQSAAHVAPATMAASAKREGPSSRGRLLGEILGAMLIFGAGLGSGYLLFHSPAPAAPALPAAKDVKMAPVTPGPPAKVETPALPESTEVKSAPGPGASRKPRRAPMVQRVRPRKPDIKPEDKKIPEPKKPPVERTTEKPPVDKKGQPDRKTQPDTKGQPDRKTQPDTKGQPKKIDKPENKGQPEQKPEAKQQKKS